MRKAGNYRIMSYEEIKFRKSIIDEGRAMIRVRYIDTKELSTAAVCPGCWNSKERRYVLLKRMEDMGVEVITDDDGIDGAYQSGKKHLYKCPYNDSLDPWTKIKIKGRNAIRYIPEKQKRRY